MTIQIQFLGLLTAVIAFALVSRRATNRWLTMPMVFVGIGLAGGPAGLGWITLNPDMDVIHGLAEATLVLVLFADASRIQLGPLRREAGLPIRLLAIGMPLTVALGTAVAMALFPHWSVWEAALLAAILAPTDAALGQAVVSSPSVPVQVRQALNVESGLNDGIALPLILVLIAVGADLGGSAGSWATFWAMQVVVGPLIGGIVGGGVGALLLRAHQAGWSKSEFTAIGGLCTAALCYVAAEFMGGNGFMGAFVGGMTFGATSGEVCDSVHRFIEREGELLMIGVFLLLGCALAAPALSGATPAVFAYAALSLTVVRMAPVALALLGAGTAPATSVFVGWFGPRGLASILFGMLLVEENELVHGHDVFDVVIITVLGSVFLHGLSAAWGAERYGAMVAEDAREHESVTAHPLRRSSR